MIFAGAHWPETYFHRLYWTPWGHRVGVAFLGDPAGISDVFGHDKGANLTGRPLDDLDVVGTGADHRNVGPGILAVDIDGESDPIRIIGTPAKGEANG